MSTINSSPILPSDPMGRVLSFLNTSELATCTVTSKNMQAESDKEHLWKEVTIKRFGPLALDLKTKYPGRTWKQINHKLTNVYRAIALAIKILPMWQKEQRSTERVNRENVVLRALGMQRDGNYVPTEIVRPTSGAFAGRKITVYKPG